MLPFAHAHSFTLPERFFCKKHEGCKSIAAFIARQGTGIAREKAIHGMKLGRLFHDNSVAAFGKFA